MEEKYTLELTFDELKSVIIALAREVDRLDWNGSPRLSEVEALEDRARDIYINAQKSNEHERSWINRVG